MPVFNGAPFLGEAIESILSQSYSDFELLIINDGSTDDSVEIIQSYSDPRIRLIDNEYNMKLIDAVNKGLSLARGVYIARMDCDDISTSQRLKKQVDFMEHNTVVGVCGSWLVQFSDTTERVWKAPTIDSEIRSEMLFNSAIFQPTVILRKHILDKYHLRYEYPFPAEDYALWLRIMERSEAANIPEILVRYRHHTGQISKLYSDNKMVYANKLRGQQLKSMGIIATKTEIHIHHKISDDTPFSSVEDAIEVGEWITKLYKQNLKTQKYDKTYFTAMLCQKWFSMCNSSTHIGLKIWRLYWTSSMSSLFSLSPAQLIKFFVKLLIRYSKQNTIVDENL